MAKLNHSSLTDTEFRFPQDWIFNDSEISNRNTLDRIDLITTRSIYKQCSHYCYFIGALYIIVVFGLKKWMKNRAAFFLKTPLFLWNASLGVFSITGFLRVAPNFSILANYNNWFYLSVCVPGLVNDKGNFWGVLFVLSKVVEFGDTVFIILRKRPLKFIQWYHHLATMVLCWKTAQYMEPVYSWFVIFNYFVHSIMYPYFALKVIGVQISCTVRNSLTAIQFAQMFIALAMNTASLHFKRSGHRCFRDPDSNFYFYIVFGSFFFLFGHLLYISLKSKKEKKAV